MSDSAFQRRQPPSPLVFTPESGIPPGHHQLQSNSGPPSSNHGSGSNTVSMPFVRRHVTRRLKAAKAECDKELQRVTNNITAFFEERLREGDHETERELRDRERDRARSGDSQNGDAEPLREAFVFHPSDLRSALQADESSSDGGYDAEPESYRRSRAPSTSASSLSPASLRRQNTAPWEKPVTTSASSSAVSSSPVTSNMPLPENTRKQNNSIIPSSWSSQGLPSRRLSRTIHITRPLPVSGQSSRSTSRSRSPMPPTTSHTSFSENFAPPPSAVLNRRSSRILVDDPIDPIMSALYDIIGVATDVTDMSVAQLTAQPKVCESLVQRIQNIGKTWDEHPDWHGRNWYVQVLLAVASLSRVVEWWEAEKQFWNFDDNDDEQDEPLAFVTKPADETSPVPPQVETLPAADKFKMTADDENKLRLSRPSSQSRRSRAEQPKALSPAPTLKDQPSPAAESPPTPAMTESARVLATERLRLQAETAQNQNIVIELSLDGDHFIWINYAWRVVLGTDPDQLAGTRISRLLSSDDWGVFKDATNQLLEDGSRTVEVRFKLQVESQDGSGCSYQQMEGKGMVMIDREDGQPSHTMWVVKPIAAGDFEGPSMAEGEGVEDVHATEGIERGPLERRASECGFPFNQSFSTDPILCRICECQIPQWYFEKHSETCVETHRLEAEIAECNESIQELRSTIRDLCVAVERTSSPSVVPEYRGMPIFSPSTSPVIPSPLQLFTRNKMKRLSVKKIQKRLLEQLEDILQVASEVSMPSLKEEESKEPIERQRLLSPGSERKMSQIRNWSKPATEDGALGQLVEDAERVMRQKIDNVVRMQNTIRYSEKIWHEWQEKVESFLATVDEGESSDEGEDDGEGQREDGEDGDHSSTTSEYAYNGDGRSSDPTPMASSSMIPSVSPETRFSFPIPMAASLYAPPSRHQVLQTRSSTPSSVSSPLALAAPIVASQEDSLPHMDLDGPAALTIKTRSSAQNLSEISDPRLLGTPPISPMVLTRESSVRSGGRGHRRHSTANQIGAAPLSPRQPSAAPLSRTSPTSIKDFDIIKPISKGAFGSVFLAKKKVTGDYFAIKVLKKADMIAKNQITNVKAERMILMKQAESPFVAKLYFTFQSKENLYLVMEYLNGGDCAALIKSIGSLPEEWTKNYIAEVVLGLEYLHQRGVVHRDLKPDNLLIDQHGHLKLTDFGLSRIGLLGRQTRENQPGRPITRYNSRSRPPSMDSAYLSSPLIYAADLNAGDDVSESSGSESHFGTGGGRWGMKTNDSPLQSFATELTNDLRSHSNSGTGSTPPGDQKFVGTPDYLAPETILGLRGDDAAVDWWALGVITYEFLYGIPPFHAETPEKVFENILSGQIEWHEDYFEFSEQAQDFMRRLMTLDPVERLGANGAFEVKAHPFFEGIDWDKVTTTEAAFIPQVDDPESTDYFDSRGAVFQLFHDEEQVAISNQTTADSPGNTNAPPTSLPVPINNRELNSPADDFGSFSFKNLPVLKLANDEMIRKLKTDQMVPLTQTLTEPANVQIRRRSISQRLKKPPHVVTSVDVKSAGPPSPATSTSSIASSPSRGSLPSSTPGSANSHARKPSEYGAVERFKLNHLDGERRNSMPSRLRTASISSGGDASGSEHWNSSTGYGSNHPESSTPPSSVHSVDLRKCPDPSDRAVTCLLAEDNPITAKIIETLLVRLGCRCVVVADGSEAISVAMGDIKFDCILMDLHMPVLDGEGAARYIKSTNGKNTNTPIVAVSAYSGIDPSEASNVFTASLSKPLQKTDLLAVMRQLGFKTSTVHSGPDTKVTATLSITS